MIRFKDTSVEKEFYQLSLQNKRLYKFALALEIFIDLELKKEILITEIHRDEATNKAQGGIDLSPHLTWEGMDLRSWIYTESEIERIKAFANTFSFRNGKQICVYHAVKNGAPHLHIQIAK
jgi:hypothetical protein